MGLAIPDLDDRTFTELMEEARTMIARYSQNQWTDHNVHDPGITFIELFAWLIEMQIYQLNQVTDANYLKFLKLVGYHPQDIQPAEVDITFNDLKTEKDIKAGITQLIAHMDTDRMVFETKEDFQLIPAELSSTITTYDSFHVDNTAANSEENIYFFAFGENAPKGATLKLGIEILAEYLFSWDDIPGNDNVRLIEFLKQNFGIDWIETAIIEKINNGKTIKVSTQNNYLSLKLNDEQTEVNLEIDDGRSDKFVVKIVNNKLNLYLYLAEKEIHLIFDLLEHDLPIPGTHGDEVPVVFPSVTVVWEYFADNEMWNDLNVIKDTSLSLYKSGRIVFRIPSDIQKGKDDGLYRIRCRLTEDGYEIVPRINRILLNSIPAIQVETVRNKILGESSGFPNQPFSLGKKPVITRNSWAYSAFSQGDVLDWPGLLKSIKKSDRGILNLFDEKIKAIIKGWIEDEEPDPQLKEATIAALNKLLENRSLYRSFEDIQLNEKWKKLPEHMDIISDKDVKTVNQLLLLAAYPEKITKGNPVIQVKDDRNEWETWIQVDDFELSGPEDPHFILDPHEGTITFGNGLNGRIPAEKHTIRALFYKTTLGPQGNIREKQKFWIDGFTDTYGENRKNASGGMSAESLDYAKNRVSNDFRKNYRAITTEDYIQLVLSTPGLRVKRAGVIPNYHPDFPCLDIPGNVTVVVVPYTRDATPVPGEGFIQTVLNHLNKHRLVTTRVHVIAPEYVTISLKCQVHLLKHTSQVRTEDRVRKKLKEFLHPIKGGPDGKGWSFGRPVFPSEISQIIDGVEGVDYVSHVSLKSEDYQYLFDWDSGDDNIGLMNFLRENFGIHLTDHTSVRKTDGNTTIVVSTDEEHIKIMLDENKENAVLVINGVRTCTLQVIKKDSRICIYGRSFQKDPVIIPGFGLVLFGDIEFINRGNHDTGRIKDPDIQNC